MVNFSKGLKSVVIRYLEMAAILFFKISPKIVKSKHYKLIVLWKLLKPILSDIETLFQKTLMRVMATAPKKAQPIRAEPPNLDDDCP